MKPSTVRTGKSFLIMAIDLTDDPNIEDCPTKSFINALTDSEQKSIINLLKRHAEAGPIQDITKSRELRNGIFEFKTRQGIRILYFYAPGRRTILTHGFKKGARLADEISRAARMKMEWEAGN
jgi:hypothetical protein